MLGAARRAHVFEKLSISICLTKPILWSKYVRYIFHVVVFDEGRKKKKYEEEENRK